MSNIDTNKTIFLSSFSGLGNNQNSDFSVTVPAQVIAPFFAIIYVASIGMNNDGSIPDVQIRYTGIDSNWYWMDGFNQYVDPGGAFIITSRAFFTGDTLMVSNFIVETLGVPLAFPDTVIDCTASLYDAPFTL